MLERFPSGIFPVRHLELEFGVVETVMIFALGFLAAALIALLIIPAVNSRAERLARRRAEALFPLSVSELTAEKDHLRAEFAVLQRQLERKAEEALAIKHQTMEELGRRAVRIQEVEDTLAERDRSIAGLEADLNATKDRLAATEEDLEQTRSALSGSRETLGALENAHRATLDELSNVRRELDLAETDLSRTRAELLQTQERLAERESAYSDADDRLTAALSELDAKRITVSDLETRLMTQTSRGDDFERALGERHGELSDERRRLTDLAKDLEAEQERRLALEQRIREIESDRDKGREIADITAARPALPTGTAAEAQPTNGPDDVRAENEELRRRIAEIAEQIMAGTASPPARIH